MTSQSPRRLRLAAAAVLGVSGLGVLPLAATAAPLPAGYTEVVLLTPQAPQSFLNRGDDGTNSTIRLEAGAPGTVAQVRFEYQVVTPGLGGSDTSAPTTIQTVSRNDDGAFAVEWAGPPAATLPGTTYNVRAVGLTGGGVVAGTDSETELTITSHPGVNLRNGSDLGFFLVPYTGDTLNHALVVASGTRGPREANGNSFFDREVKVGSFVENGSRTGGVTSAPLTNSAAGPFAVQLDLGTGAVDLTAGAVNQVALWSDLRRNGTLRDVDTESYTLYRQSITTVTATPDRSNVAPGESAAVTVKVVDQRDQPIVGAQVMQVIGSGTATAVGTTGVDGTITPRVAQPGGTTAYYYANADDVAAYDATKGDKRSANVTVTDVQTVPTKLVGTSADGPAFDLDEVDNVPGSGTGTDGDATDVTVQVKDQQGNDMSAGAGQVMEYYWTVTPFTGGTASRFPATGTSTGTSEGGGTYSVVVPSGGNGTYELFASLTADPISTDGAIASSRVLTVKAGQAAITWDKTSPQEAPAGSTSDVTGRLALSDGTGLTGRALGLTFQRDTNTADEDQTPDAGFTSGGGVVTTTTVTTAGGGAFAVSVTDPAETPQLPELGDNIDAASATNEFGNAGATRNDQVVNFVVDTTPSAMTLSESREGATLRPGEFTLYTVRVTNRLGGGIANRDVLLTTDKGYFSLDDGSAQTTSPTPSPSPVTGADAGTYRNDGKSVTIKTGPDGSATVFLAMGRDTGFDDDGLLVSRVTATSGTLSRSDDHAWSSSDPLNGGSVDLRVSDRAQDSAILPDAQLADRVFVDVVVTDQFGNRVGGESVALTDNSATGVIAETDGTENDGTVISDFVEEGDATLTSTSDADQTVTATWVTERTSYTGSGTSTTTSTETLTDSYTVEWYEVDYSASSISLSPGSAGPRKVGDLVTFTYKAIDQLGQPISDLFIGFTRSGPGATSDMSGSHDALTGEDGIATYTFAGTDEGRADVTATARQGASNGDVVSAASRTASVTFAAEQVEPVKPSIDVDVKNRGRKVVLKVLVEASTQDPVVGEVKIQDGGQLVGLKELRDGKRKFVFRGVSKGRHVYKVKFLGNDEVRRGKRVVRVRVG